MIENEQPHTGDWFRTAVQWIQRGEVFEATRCLQQVLRHDPNHAEAWNNLGVLLAQHGRIQHSITCFSRAIQAKPGFADAHRNLSRAQAELNGNGSCQLSSSHPFDAQFAIAELLYSHGVSQLSKGQLDVADRLFNSVLAQQPEHGLAHHGLALTAVQRGELPKAMVHINCAIQYEPNAADLRYDRARIQLQLGNFEAGWPEFEYRWLSVNSESRNFVQPRWEGCACERGAILVHSEQGIGDVFQFVRYVRMVKDRFKGTVYFACPPAFHSLLSTCEGIDQLVGMGPEFPSFDFQIPLLSLPAIFKTNENTIPRQVPYLFAHRSRSAYWKQYVKSIAGFKIGLIWRGSSTYAWDHQRSIPLHHFEPIAKLPNIQLIGLLKSAPEDEIKACRDQWSMIDMGPRIDNDGQAFADTAAIMTHLDLVIAADTSAAHLAGALGVPIWLLQWKVPEWRWLIGRDTSPWYPSMKLFQQKIAGDWDELIQRIVSELQHTMQS